MAMNERMQWAQVKNIISLASSPHFYACAVQRQVPREASIRF